MNEDIAAIEAARARIGASKSELAMAAGIHPTTYQKLADGASKQPHRRTLSRLRKALDHLESGEVL